VGGSNLVRQTLGPRFRLNLCDILEECAPEFLGLVKPKLESSTLKKANRQIRETKAHFGALDAKGLLLLVNDGNYMLPPNMALHLLSRSLTGQYSSISSVIYFSVNESVSVPGLPMESMFWIDGLVPGREPVSPEFRQALQTAWMKHYSGLVPGPIFEFEGNPDPDMVDKLQFPKVLAP